MKIKLILHYLKNYKGVSFLYAILVLASIVFTIATVVSLADFLRILFDTSEANAHLAEKTNYNLLYVLTNKLYVWLISFGREKAILIFSILLFGLYLFKNLFGYFAAYTCVSIRNKVIRDIRNDFFEKTLRLPISYFSKARKGDILTRFSDDAIQVDEYILRSLFQLTVSIISVILYIMVLFYTNVPLTFFVLLCLPISAFGISRISRKLKQNSTTLQQKTSFLMSLVEETLGGVRIIKAYNAISFSNDRFKKFNHSYTRLKNSIYRRIDLASPVSDFLGNTIVMGILILGSYFVLHQKSGFTSELFITYIILFVLIINPAKDASTAVSQIKKGQASLDRINEFLSNTEGVEQTDSPFPISSFESRIEFQSVSFSYEPRVSGDSMEVDSDGEKTMFFEKEQVLSDLNFLIQKGQTIAIVGPSGAGKSTLVDLFMRFYNPTEGQIILDGVSVQQYKLRDYRKLMGLVTQDTLLFNDSVFNNIVLGYAEATMDEVVRASKIANAHEFIMQLEKGYDTSIGDYGGKLSGGQKQRISIARAILRDPPILVFDEATSALDTESEHVVQEALKSAAENRTTLLIAHRLSTVIHADCILVLEKGKIVQKGTHQNLLEEEGLYKRLSTMQMLK